MMSNPAKRTTFKRVSLEEWQEVAQQSLKAKPLQSLNKETYEGMTLTPLYTGENINQAQIDQYPGTGSYARGFGSTAGNGWHIAQKIKHSDWEEGKRLLSQALASGQDTISIQADHLLDINEFSFSELDQIMDVERNPLFMLVKSDYSVLVEKLLQSSMSDKLSGALAADILTAGLADGSLIDQNGELIKKWTANLKKVDRHYPLLKTIVIDTAPFNAGGANAVQELGIALAEAVFYIEHLKKEGWDPAKTVNKMVFHFAVGSNFFMEVAKFRAFRILWKTVADAYELSPDENSVVVSAETSAFTKSTLDSYVNLLRAGNEAFTAVLGGIDYLHVSPFDEVTADSNDFSARIARNTQLLFHEESHVNKVIDPAGGSYYLESLTADLVESGWRFFQDLDRRGGIFQALESGSLQLEINKTLEKRMEDVKTRAKSMIGVNVFAQLNEKPTFPQSKIAKPNAKAGEMEAAGQTRFISH